MAKAPGLARFQRLRPTIVLLSVGILAGCAADAHVDTVYDPCSPLTIAVASDLSAAELSGIEGAILAWQHVLPTQIVVGAGPRSADVLPLRFEPGETFFRGNYWDSLGQIEISRDQLDPEDYALAIAHEMGHAFGLLHVSKEDRPSVMNVGNLEIAPTEEDGAAVRALWATCRDAAPAD